METHNEFAYLKPFEGQKISREIMSLVAENYELQQLITSLTQACRAKTAKAHINQEEVARMTDRLTLLQGCIDRQLYGCIPLSGAVRKLDEGVSATFALPNPENIHRLNKGDCKIPSLRFDIAQHTKTGYGRSIDQAGIQLLVACGITTLDFKARIEHEDLDGVMIFLHDEQTLKGSQVKFNGPRLATPETVFSFKPNHQPAISQIWEELWTLPFLHKRDNI